jgi:hypothetical protein
MSNNTYNKLEDQGWEKMKAMLDAEMPVEGSPKRRAILWWWTGAASILVLLAGLMFFDSPNDTKGIASKNSNKEQITVNNNPKTTDNQQSTKKSATGLINEKFQNRTTTALTSSEKTEKKTSNFANSNFSPPSNKIASNLSLNRPEKSTAGSSKFKKEEIKDRKSDSKEITSELVISENSRKEIIPITALDLIQNQGVQMNPSLTSDLAIETAKTRKITWRVQSGILMEDLSQIRGWSLGFSGNHSLKSPRWSVQAGLAYSRINQPLAYFSTTDDDSFQDEKITGLDSVEHTGYNSYDISRISARERFSINQSYHFLEIPLRINYKLSPKWELYAGIKPSFRFEFPEKNNAEYLSVSADASSLNNSVYTIPVEFPTFNLHALGGVQYQAGKHFYLWTQWEQNIPTQQRLVSFVNSRLAIGAGFQW